MNKKRWGQTIVLEKPAFHGDRTRILIVDDEEQLRNMLCRILESEGYAVDVADSAETAILLLKGDEYNLILSDIMMPGKSGIELLEEAQNICPLTEFILMTGYPKVSAAVSTIKAGAYDYISKPFEINDLKEKVKEALDHAKRVKNERLDETDTLCQKASRKLAGFDIVRTLGEGAMGIVFLVERTVNQKPVRFAMKIIKTDEQDGKSDKVERFFKEARAAGDLKHPNIVQVLEHGYAREENIPYLVMEYFESDNLHNMLMNNERPDLQTSVKIIIQIADGLHTAHKAGIVHRDIKPDNILIDKIFRAKLTDFGVAQLPGSHQTDVMKMIGTPYYISPESFNSPKVDLRADIYSLGTVAYELFLGVKPFEIDVISLLGYKVQTENPPEPIKQNKEFPINLQHVLQKMLMKDPDKRYQSAHEVSQDLRNILQKGFKHKIFFAGEKWNTL